ncbi:ATP-grasp domain-containing protein [Luteimonas sp. 50]|uniref:ATP-grasp domain-containing protein n=2 Tax=Cognatiluteimonas sedimenti TaxID=2927791 RepID=A0ABT0A3Z5_9GAMM|nr:ATP-grasp domain-containing protein [Lysobacter sedimenti]MCJ0825706.1 ATP-grasp domain-containing protein [Lysobacter sedimenti]
MADYFRPHLLPGERIIGTSHSAWTVGLAACDEAVILPPIESGEYLETVLDLCGRREINAVLSFYDPDVAFLSSHRDSLANAGCMPLLATPRTVAIAYDKSAMHDRLRAMGYLVPYTVATIEEAEASISEGLLRFPLVVKPRRGFGSLNTFVANTVEQMRVFHGYAADMLVQEFIVGEELNSSIFSDMDARVLSVVPCRKRLMAGGETQHAESIEHPGLLALSHRLAEDIGSVGPLDVDFMESRDGRLYVLDLNPRFGGAYPVAQVAGADFPSLAMAIIRGNAVAPTVGAYRRGVYMMKAIAIAGGPLTSLDDRSYDDRRY